MPKLTSPSLLLLLVTATASASETAPAPHPARDDDSVNTSPAPSPADADINKHFLITCVEKFTDKCGNQVFRGVFSHATSVMELCCKNLVHDVGKKCHDGLVRRIYDAGVRRISEGNVGVVKDHTSRVFPRSEKVWNDCVRLGRVLPARIRWLP